MLAQGPVGAGDAVVEAEVVVEGVSVVVASIVVDDDESVVDDVGDAVVLVVAAGKRPSPAPNGKKLGEPTVSHC